MILKSKI